MARPGGDGKYVNLAEDRRFAERPLPTGQWVGAPGGVEVCCAERICLTRSWVLSR